VRNRKNVMSSQAVHIVATNTEISGLGDRECERKAEAKRDRVVVVDPVIQTRIRRQRDMLRWGFCLWKHVVGGKEGKKSPRHRRDMNVNSVWSGWTCVGGCGRSDVVGWDECRRNGSPEENLLTIESQLAKSPSGVFRFWEGEAGRGAVREKETDKHPTPPTETEDDEPELFELGLLPVTTTVFFE
jgi:hypothetical protein